MMSRNLPIRLPRTTLLQSLTLGLTPHLALTRAPLLVRCFGYPLYPPGQHPYFQARVFAPRTVPTDEKKKEEKKSGWFYLFLTRFLLPYSIYTLLSYNERVDVGRSALYTTISAGPKEVTRLMRAARLKRSDIIEIYKTTMQNFPSGW
jgi:hypothetical protein